MAVKRNAAACATKIKMVPAAAVAKLEAVVPAAASAVYVPTTDELSEESARYIGSEAIAVVERLSRLPLSSWQWRM